VAVLVLLGVFRRPAWQASSAGLATALVLAIVVWDLPTGIALSSVLAGATFALIPVMWIVFNALILYNVTVVSGRFQSFRDWMLDHLPNDRRVVLVVIGFCFGCLLEGVAGFGTPVAFGALGAPVTTLGAVTQLPDTTLAAMVGRQLPFFALLLPFYAVGLYGGVRAISGVWPVLLIAGASFASGQFFASNYLGFALTDVISSAFSLIVTIAFLKLWRGKLDPQFALAATSIPKTSHSAAPAAGWIPWIILATTVVLWIHLKVNLVGQMAVHWPRLHEEVFITIYDKPYAAIWTFQPLGTGTAILFATVLTAFLVGLEARQVSVVLRLSLVQIRLPAVTTTLIIGLAYLMNYSGMTYTLGVGAASAGAIFPLLSAFLGWLAVSLSGSDTSGNALFGNLQVVAARQLDLNPVLMAATNSSGGVFGKMISPQNISTGTSTTELKGREGDVFARTFKHSVILAFLLGLLVLLQQYVFPWMIP
jgi:lactate permease